MIALDTKTFIRGACYLCSRSQMLNRFMKITRYESRKQQQKKTGGKGENYTTIIELLELKKEKYTKNNKFKLAKYQF